jgi:hypothetical protein
VTIPRVSAAACREHGGGTAQCTALKFYAPGIQHEPKQRVCLVYFGCLLTYGQFLRTMHLSRPVHDYNPGEMFGLETLLIPITMAILGAVLALAGSIIGRLIWMV